ncbi:flavodoxin [Marinifilum breve]|uniref:Flavodoxin n=1 Tax=Marinifilum breve TaxID=2184082 RepID=A0A2V4A012_9BACT|nr:flavodoxin [Marinifilum breve]PXY02072.1 flavodoxin [Marinifilum breve]
MSNTAIIYGSTTGNTENVANQLAGLLNADLFDASTKPTEALIKYDNLILGTSTWGAGDLQDDWEDFISEIDNANLSEKVVGLFGLGDGCNNGDTFVGGMAQIYNVVKDSDCKIVGSVDIESYEFEESDAVVDGKFIGLALDEENQGDLSEERINKWVEQISKELK